MSKAASPGQQVLFELTARGGPPLGHPAQPADDTPVVVGFGGPDPCRTPADVIAEHRVLVTSVVRRYSARPWHGIIDLEDLQQEAYVALLRAHARFDPSRGVPFAAFARLTVERAILDTIRNADPLPALVRRQVIEMQIAREDVEHARDRASLADSLGCTPDELLELERCENFSEVSSLSELAERVPSQEDDYEVTSKACMAAAMQRVQRAMRTLPDQHRRIAFLYLTGLRSLREIAEIEGISHTRVRQIVTLVVEEVRDYLSSESADESS